MAMLIAKSGARKTSPRITISTKTKIITFSAGFLRAHALSPDNTRYARFGFDPDIQCIGVDLRAKSLGRGESLKLTWSKGGSNASCPIRSLLSVADLTIEKIAGAYEEARLQGPLAIEGFSEHGWLLGPINRK